VKQHSNYPVHGAGLGLRRGPLMQELLAESSSQDSADQAINFLEVAPENWMRVGGRLGRQFRQLTERYDFTTHGLSLSIGGPAPLDEAFLQELKIFLQTHDIKYYSEHLSYCSDDGHLYDLMPIPFTEDAVNHVAERIQRCQDILGQRIAVENVSYYAAPAQEMAEIDFINAVLEKADCDLLLDVNNIYVNSINHQYNAAEFLSQLPWQRIRYCHVAGHFDETEDLRVDTHGADVIDPVWTLLAQAYAEHGVMPTLLERDFNIPPLAELKSEITQIHQLQNAALSAQSAASA
jgi:uncharacterized protein (UPF0276 family)